MGSTFFPRLRSLGLLFCRSIIAQRPSTSLSIYTANHRVLYAGHLREIQSRRSLDLCYGHLGLAAAFGTLAISLTDNLFPGTTPSGSLLYVFIIGVAIIKVAAMLAPRPRTKVIDLSLGNFSLRSRGHLFIAENRANRLRQMTQLSLEFRRKYYRIE